MRNQAGIAQGLPQWSCLLQRAENGDSLALVRMYSTDWLGEVEQRCARDFIAFNEQAWR